MKLKTKQTEVRLVAENDLDEFYLENFFTDNSRPYVVKSDGFGRGTVVVSISYEKPE